MEKLKEWLTVGLTVVFVLVVGVFVVLPIYLVAMLTSFAFVGARYINNAVAAITVVATVSYFGYLARSGSEFGAESWAALGIMLAMIIAVAVWDVAAWALWRWQPDWLDAILPDEDPPPSALSKQLDDWLTKLSQKAETAINVILAIVFIVVFAVLPFTFGMEWLIMVLDFTLEITLALTACALAWPVIALIGWLPRCRKRKFDEFFCAATRNCEVLIFGKVLEDDQEQKDETSDVES